MASSRPVGTSRGRGRQQAVWRIALAAALCASGAALVLALTDRLYANALLAVLVACWLAAVSLARIEPPPAPVPPRARRDADGEERRRLTFMLDHAPVPLLVLRATGSLHAVNRAARTLFGTDDIVAADAILRAGDDSEVPDGRRTLAEAIGQSGADRTRMVHLAQRLRSGAAGQVRGYALSVASLTGAQDSVRLAALVDIQSEIQQAEAAALRELLQTLSHEIMNSLTPVISLAETASELLQDGGDRAQAREAIATIARRTAGLDRFVHGYRQLVRVPPPVRRVASIGRLMQDAALLFEARWRGHGVELRLDLPQPDIQAELDPDLISQALLALLTNGAEAALAVERARWVSLTAGIADGRAWLQVEDSGDGVAADEAALIFRPLYTTRANGSGIGLGVARQIARGHGGDLTLESSPPARSARFVLRLN